MSAKSSLPSEFADLEPWVEQWALATERERYFYLLSRSIDQLRPFYDAMLPRASACFAYLSTLPASEALPEPARTLYDLLLTFVETAHPIELNWKQTDINSPVEANRLRFHGPSAERYARHG